MRIVLITGDGLEHRYVANRLAQAVDLTAIVVDHGRPLARWQRARQLWRRYTLPQLFSRAALAAVRMAWGYSADRDRVVASTLGAECLEFQRPELLHHVRGINAPESVRLVASLEPDVILVFGTGIVGTTILSLARRVALNMHTGISPFYRGCDCTFWPLHNDELHLLGATVHECTMQVDGGRVFGTTGIQLHSDDSLFMVYARCVMAGADLYASKVRELNQREVLEGAAQDLSLGKEYKAYMRGLRAEWRVRRLIQGGLIRRFVKSAREQTETAGPDGRRD